MAISVVHRFDSSVPCLTSKMALVFSAVLSEPSVNPSEFPELEALAKSRQAASKGSSRGGNVWQREKSSTLFRTTTSQDTEYSEDAAQITELCTGLEQAEPTASKDVEAEEEGLQPVLTCEDENSGLFPSLSAFSSKHQNQSECSPVDSRSPTRTAVQPSPVSDPSKSDHYSPTEQQVGKGTSPFRQGGSSAERSPTEPSNNFSNCKHLFNSIHIE